MQVICKLEKNEMKNIAYKELLSYYRTVFLSIENERKQKQKYNNSFYMLHPRGQTEVTEVWHCKFPRWLQPQVQRLMLYNIAYIVEDSRWTI